MPKQINVKLGFEADTSQAKKQIQDLQKSLDNLLTSSTKNSTFKEFKDDVLEAQQSVFKLQGVLSNSLNADTGRLDLSKFNAQLDAADMSIGTLAADMRKLGPDGERAFLNLANSIVTAQKPMMETNKLLDSMWTALKNTARWQLSSSILHGFMSSLQGAYGYAQDLNASLNSIRIVSGQSVEQMAEFADQANKSAQALSTSTLAYTDAALIFYQQGLSGDAVTERVDTVLKLSNVTGDSAEQVSNYMTAIWNNFYDGSESLESFADKITALGAATASSSAEISAGLQQFAAIGQTVGLSYDYAATALATIVAQTRQSESTVGNGLRTIFARLSSLKQGDETEDGVDLTKYTAALQEVGVNVMDQNGQLKEMDQILEDIGSKWNTLSKNQQVALAQTVGGVRQYATLIALFDNWDQFQRNLDVTQNAEGTLEKQAEIYAESWEGARKRVQTAWQAIYQDLIDDKFFISILNGIADVLKGVDKLIDSIGGLKGVLGTVSTLIITIFNKQLVQGFEKAQQAMRNIKLPWQDSSLAEKQSDAMVMILKNQLDDMYPKNSTEDVSGNTEDYILKGLKDQVDLNYQLKSMYDDLTDSQREFANGLIKQTEELHNSVVEAAKLRDTFSANALEAKRNINNSLIDFKNNGDAEEKAKAYDFKTYIENVGNTKEFEKLINVKSTEEYERALDNLTQSYAKQGNAVGVATKYIRDYIDAKAKAKKADQDLDETNKKYNAYLEKTSERLNQLKDSHERGATSSTYLREELDKVIASLEEEKLALEAEIQEKEKSGENTDNLKIKLAELNNELEKARDLQDSFSFKGLQGLDPQVFVTAAKGISELVSGLTAINRALEIFEDKDPDLTWMDKITKALPSLMMGLPMVSKAMKDLTPTIGAVATAASESFAAAGAGLSGLLAALKAGIAVLWEFIGPALIVIGIFIALKKAWDAYQASTPEGKLKAAREELEKATEKANEAKQAYDDLKSTFESYNDLKENINDMDETDRAKAVAEMNSEMLDLITNTENWATIFKDGIEYDESTGLIKVTEAQQELLRKEEAKAYFAAQRLETEKKIIELNAGEKKEDSDLSFQFKKFANGGNVTSEVLDALANNNLQGLKDYNSLIQDVENKDISDEEKESQIVKLEKLQQEQTDSIKQALLQAGFSEEEIEGNLLPQIENVISNEDALKEMVGAILDHISNDSQEKAYQDQLDRDYLSSVESDAGYKDKNGEEVKYNGFNELDSESQKIALDWYQSLDPDTVQKEFQASMESGNGLLETIKQLEGEYPELEKISDDLNRKLESTNEIIHGTLSDSDVDEEEFSDLSNFLSEFADKIPELSDDLKYSQEAANDLAESILRFDDAIQDVTEHYDDWLYTLENGSVQDKAEAVSQLKDAYADMLDVSENAFENIPNFLENTENLELMKQAAEGVEGAYEHLQQNLQNEILGKVELDTAEFESKYADVIAMSNTELGTMEIGAYLDDEQVIDALNNMIQSMNLTEAEAEALLQSMGWDADVEQVEVPESQQQAFINAIPHVDYVDNAVSTTVLPSGLTEEQPIKVPIITYDAIHQTEKSEGEKTVTMLRIKSAKKSAGGNFKYSNAKHGGGTQGSNGPSAKKNGGGGGGSKGSQPKKKTVKDYAKKDFTEDRYHNIKSAINEVSKELERLDKLQERAYGKSKLKYMDLYIQKLEDQARLVDVNIEEAKKYMAMDRADLEGLGMGAMFTDEGRLLNYEQVLQNILASYNGAVDAYNGAVDQFNASAQEDSDNQMLENAKKQLDKAKEIYDKNKEILKKYEDSYKELQDATDKKIEILNQIYDQKLAKVVWKVDIQLEVNNADIEFLQWLQKYLEKDASKGVDVIANLSKQMQDFSKNITAVSSGLKELFQNHGIENFESLSPEQLVEQLQKWQDQEGLGSELTEKEAQQIRDWMSQLMKTADDMDAAFTQAHETVTKTLKESNDEIDRELKKLDDYNDLLDNYQDIIDLTGQSLLGINNEDILDIDNTRLDNSKNYLESLKAQKEANEATLKEILAVDTTGFTEDSLREWKKIREEAEDAVRTSTQNYYNQFKKTMEDAQKVFEDTMKAMEEEYKKTLGDLDRLIDRFALYKDIEHLYLDDYEKYHEINKDMKALQKTIDSTNNSMLKSKLLDFQDELNAAQKDGVRISEIQAGVYERRVALLQAEAELLNAQNAKNAVRMTRDNEGNFSYTYTADQEAIDGAEENYGEKFYDYLHYIRDNQESLQEQALQKRQEYFDKVREITEAAQRGEIDNADELIAELTEKYEEYNAYFLEQQNFLFDESARLRDEDLAYAEEITGLKLANEDDFVAGLHETIYGKIRPDITSAEQMWAEWDGAIKTAHTASLNAIKTWENNVKGVYNAAGLDVDGFKGKVKLDLDAIDKESDETKKHAEDMAKGMKEKMSEVIGAAATFDSNWAGHMLSMRNAIIATVGQMNDMLSMLTNLAGYEVPVGTNADYMGGAFARAGNQAEGAAGQFDRLADALNNAAEAMKNFQNAGNGNSNSSNNGSAKDLIKQGVNEVRNNVSDVQDPHMSRDGIYFGGPASGATGMYTGEWGSEGKLAILHEKELVLNKEDTANMLNVVDMVRGIANKIDLSDGLNKIVDSMSNVYQLAGATAGAGTLDQNVHIEANFPNVESRTEIEMAFNNLINSASQYVNRKI